MTYPNLLYNIFICFLAYNFICIFQLLCLSLHKQLKGNIMAKKNFIYNVHFLIIVDSDVRHENYPFTLKKNASVFFKEKVKEEKKKVLEREKELYEEWIIEKEQGTDFTEYDMYRSYASNIDRVTIRLEKLELN